MADKASQIIEFCEKHWDSYQKDCSGFLKALAHQKYPTAYWGSIGGVGQKNKTVNWSWNKTDRDQVIYACLQV